MEANPKLVEALDKQANQLYAYFMIEFAKRLEANHGESYEGTQP